MRSLVGGHVYELDHLDGTGKERLQFVDRGHGHNAEGTYNQEVIRALIDRVQFLDREVPWPLNAAILHHLRMALVLHEARAICRKTEQGKLLPESLEVGTDGHFIFKDGNA